MRPKPRARWNRTAARDANARVAPAPAATARVGSASPPVRPAARSGPVPVSVPVPVPVFFNAMIRPKPRPWIDRTRPAGRIAAPVIAGSADPPQGNAPAPIDSASAPPKPRGLASSVPVFSSPRPLARSANLSSRAVAQAQVPVQSRAALGTTGPQGAICGNPAIRGREIPAIAGRLAGCGVQSPVQVSAVGGVVLSTPATMTCDTAQALLTWTERGAKPAVGRLGGGIRSYRVLAHYACRTRNNQPRARISEHGKGRAIDIAAITLNNGVEVTVLHGWEDPMQGSILRRMWRAACGPFGTVLGPDANRFHRDHFHFDTAVYRSGSYCR